MVGQVIELRLDQIDLTRNAFEFRVDPRVDDLVEDFDRHGQQFAIVVRPIKGSTKHEVVAGFRRTRAQLERGAATVKAIVRNDLDDDAAYSLSFTENERRQSLTALDKAHAIAKLRLLGKTATQIKSLYGLGDKQLTRYEKVVSFPKVLRDAVAAQRIASTHALLLAQAHEQHADEIVLKSWVEHVVEQELSVRQLCSVLRAKFGGAKKKTRYLERGKGGAFRLFPMRFDPKTTEDSARKKMLEALTTAIAALK